MQLEEKNLAYLVTSTLAQFVFFERAVPLLQGATDLELHVAIDTYGSFLAALACKGEDKEKDLSAPESLAVELAWRTHQLNPLAYLAACNVLSTAGNRDSIECKHECKRAWQDVLGLDLVAAIRRQEIFMASMLAQRSVYDSPLVVNDAVREYCKFLASMRHCDRVLEPTPLVDLVWHTHQQMPFHYRKDCLRLAGRLIDHHDSPCYFETIRKMHEGG